MNGQAGAHVIALPVSGSTDMSKSSTLPRPPMTTARCCNRVKRAGGMQCSRAGIGGGGAAAAAAAARRVRWRCRPAIFIPHQIVCVVKHHSVCGRNCTPTPRASAFYFQTLRKSQAKKTSTVCLFVHTTIRNGPQQRKVWQPVGGPRAMVPAMSRRPEALQAEGLQSNENAEPMTEQLSNQCHGSGKPSASQSPPGARRVCPFEDRFLPYTCVIR